MPGSGGATTSATALRQPGGFFPYSEIPVLRCHSPFIIHHFF